MAEIKALGRRLVAERHVLEQAENMVNLDQPDSTAIGDALDLLARKLPKKIIRPVFAKYGLKKLTNFWLVTTPKGRFKGNR